MNRKLTIIAGILWLAGIAGFIAGLNIDGDTGTWLMVIGQIVFLIGLGLEGVLFFRQRKLQPSEDGPENKPEDQPEDGPETQGK